MALVLRQALYDGEMKKMGRDGALQPPAQWTLFHDTLGFLLRPDSMMLLAIETPEPGQNGSASPQEKAVGMLALQTGATFGMLASNTVSIVWLYVDPTYRDGEVMLALYRVAEQAVTNPNGTPIVIQAAVRSANTEVMEALTRSGYNPIAVVLEKTHERTNTGSTRVESGQSGRRADANAGSTVPGREPELRPGTAARA